jgi:hypothetical protein
LGGIPRDPRTGVVFAGDADTLLAAGRVGAASGVALGKALDACASGVSTFRSAWEERF